MGKRFIPELMHNYSPVIKPMPPLEIMTVCDKPLACITFSAALVPYLLGLLEIYRWEESFSGTQEERERSAGICRDLMEKLAMSDCCCGDTTITLVVMHRMTLAGVLEISVDNGTTWTPDPNSIASQAPIIAPVMAGIPAEDRCRLASNGLHRIQEVVTEWGIAITTIATIGQLLTRLVEVAAAAILLLLDLGVIESLVVLFAEVARKWFGSNIEEWNALWTEEVWDALLCILECDIGDDGFFSGTQFSNVMADIESQIPGGAGYKTAGETLRLILKGWQEQGLNAACAVDDGIVEDCSACDCEDCTNIDEWTDLNASTLGHIIERDSHSITVEGRFDPDRDQWTAMAHNNTPGFHHCCVIQTVENIVGARNASWAMSVCGNEPRNDNMLSAGVEGTSINGFRYHATTAFTIKVTFNP